MEEPGRVYSGPRREELASLKITSLFKVQLQKRTLLYAIEHMICDFSVKLKIMFYHKTFMS